MPESDPRPQSEKFADLARELDCDEEEEAFTEAVRKVATAAKPAKDKLGDPR